MREKEDHYKNLDEETSRLVGKFLDIPVLKENHEKYRNERGKVNMCTAIRDMVKNGEKRGEERGEKRNTTTSICHHLVARIPLSALTTLARRSSSVTMGTASPSICSKMQNFRTLPTNFHPAASQ